MDGDEFSEEHYAKRHQARMALGRSLIGQALVDSVAADINESRAEDEANEFGPPARVIEMDFLREGEE